MGRGKSWSREESEAVAKAWKMAAEVITSPREQNTKHFARELYDCFRSLCPLPNSGLNDGRWLARSQSAVKVQFDAIADDILKFNIAASTIVEQALKRGLDISDPRILRAAIALHLGALSDQIIAFDDVDIAENDWKLYDAWRILKTCRRFAPVGWADFARAPPSHLVSRRHADPSDLSAKHRKQSHHHQSAARNTHISQLTDARPLSRGSATLHESEDQDLQADDNVQKLDHQSHTQSDRHNTALDGRHGNVGAGRHGTDGRDADHLPDQPSDVDVRARDDDAPDDDDLDEHTEPRNTQAGMSAADGDGLEVQDTEHHPSFLREPPLGEPAGPDTPSVAATLPLPHVSLPPDQPDDHLLDEPEERVGWRSGSGGDGVGTAGSLRVGLLRRRLMNRDGVVGLGDKRGGEGYNGRHAGATSGSRSAAVAGPSTGGFGGFGCRSPSAFALTDGLNVVGSGTGERKHLEDEMEDDEDEDETGFENGNRGKRARLSGGMGVGAGDGMSVDHGEAVQTVGDALRVLGDALSEYNAISLFSRPDMQGRQDQKTFFNALAEKHALKARLDRDRLIKVVDTRNKRERGF